MNWAFYSFFAAILWGVGFTILVPASAKLKVYTIYTLYGLSTFLVNLAFVAITNGFDDFKLLGNWKTAMCLISYIILSIVASIIFLLGYKVEGINPGIYIMISNAYPIITLILSFFFLGKTNINPYYASFGIILTFIGCGLLAMSNK
jgi:drug/metabolite transporter (DMT)-like permease